MNEDKVVIALVLVSCLVFGFIGFVVSEDITRKTWQQECVKRDFAEYNPKTGAWQWKGDDKTQP